MIPVAKRRSFWYLSLNDILTILCAIAVPIALGIYTAITYQQEQEQIDRAQEFNLQQATELRRDSVYDQLLSNMYRLDKDGYLNDSQDPWAFANAYYRTAHRQLDPTRKADLLQFLKEKKLVGRSNCTAQCLGLKIVPDIIRLEELNFDYVKLISQTGSLNQLKLDCVVFNHVSLIGAIFLYSNLNGASFDHGRLNNAKFYDVSLKCATFDGVDLHGTDFGNADLTGAHFANVDLSTAKLTKQQLKQASFYNTIMPDGTKSGITTSTTSTSSSTTSTSTTSTTSTSSSTTSTSTTSTSSSTTSTSTLTTSTSSTTSTTSTSSTTTSMSTVITTEMSSTIIETSTIAKTMPTTKNQYLTTQKHCTTVITFDDIPGQSNTSGVIPNSYKNFTWMNANYISDSILPISGAYQNKRHSRPFAMYQSIGTNLTISTLLNSSFRLYSAYFATDWPHPANITILCLDQARTHTVTVQFYGLTAGNLTLSCIFNTLIFVAQDVAFGNNSVVNSTGFIVDDVCIFEV
ncbi:unnamed protein product [Adineta ricciae]|uniref:Pentapeptide repeat-containing protein n=1 Tax=Adineta ricciae TaxID=249248 RepID=A0A815W4U2_ADIRI|nr:unnamed protein product [Adineta ricciae]CAF1536348.1 unnamed protein product [Adineta ricciae]